MPELAHAEQQEHHAERVDLAPDDAVEPGDRVEDEDRRADQGPALRRAEIEDEPIDQLADREVGQDRRQLHQVRERPRPDRLDADAVERSRRPARRPRARTGSPGCSRRRSRGRRSRAGPGRARLCAQNSKALRSTLKPDPGSRYAMMSRKSEPGCEERPDRTGRVPRIGRPRGRCRVPAGLARDGAGQRGPPSGALRRSGV